MKINLRNLLLAFFALISCPAFVVAQAQYPDTVEFTTSGSWVVPKGVFSATLEAWGGGGAGGYAKNTTSWFTRAILRPTGGGGGGAYARSIIEVVPGNTMTVEVGVQGSTSGNNTENPTVVSGRNSYVRYNDAVQVLAEGGKTVAGVRNTTGAQGGKAENCTYNDVAFSGGNGGDAYAGVLNTGAYCASGGGGGAAGVSADGSNGGDGASYNKGDGGAAGAGNPSSGNGGDGVASTIISGNWGGNSGEAGENYGGGGGGSISNAAAYKPGASGAPGYVRIAYIVTVLDVNDWRDTICSTSNFNYTPQDEIDGIVPAGTQYTWTIVQNTSNITGATDQTTPVDAITGTLTNAADILDSVVYEVTAHYNEYTTTFTVSVVVYPEQVAGTISKDQLVCQDMVIDQIVSDTDPSGGDADHTVSWQVSHDNGTTWSDIPDVTEVIYTPTPNVLSSVSNLIRRVYTTGCGTVYSNELTMTNPNPLSPGSITVTGDPAGSYCSVNVNATLTANPTANSEVIDPVFYYQWQESYDQGATWSDISGAVSKTYEVALNPVDDTVSYRYQVRYETCDWMISNNTYDIIYLVDPDYTEQIETLHVVLYFGNTDTVFSSLPAPNLTPAPINITPNFDMTTRRGTGTYTINWNVEGFCGSYNYDQVVEVEFPICDETEDAVDYEGNHYPVVAVGGLCWLAKNLRSTKYADGADIPVANAYYSPEYPDRDANVVKFGRLYSWYSAMNLEENSTENPPVVNGPTGAYVQGACPKGWAIPTQEEYARLWAAIGAADNAKSSDATTWIPGEAGLNPGSGFDAPGAGYYNNDIYRYENLLGQTNFWSCSTGTIVQKGVCCVLTHSCPVIMMEENMKGMGFSIRCVRKE